MTEREFPMVLIGLGSNRGDSGNLVASAMERLAEYATGGMLRSDLWRTSPVDCPPDSGDFINAAVAFQARPELTPEALLVSLKALEVEYGRGPALERNAPRELDLDLLLFDEQTRDTPDFVLPHPRAVNRRFVLAPAAQVAPDLVWPGLGATIAELLDALHSDERVEVLDATPVD